MAATALIQFTQGANVGANGQALLGITGTSVALSNADNTSVASWQVDIYYTPPGSSISIAIPYSFNNNSSTPSASFTPDVAGSYRIGLTVWDGINRTGTGNIDIRVFAIPELGQGFIVPPTQIFPRSLPPLATGAAGAKPNEMNFSGQPDGWAGGTGSAKLLDSLVRYASTSRSAFLTQTQWHIDSAAGLDSNSGLDASNKIATCAEFCRRVAPHGQYQLTVDTDVYIYSTTAADDYLSFFVAPIGSAGLRVHGVPTAATFTTNAVTNKNTATPVMPTVSAIGLGSSHVGKLLKMNTGTLYAWAMANPSGTILRTSNFVTVTLGSLVMASGNPTNADTLTVYTLPKITDSHIRFTKNNGALHYFELLEFGATYLDVYGRNVTLHNCKYGNTSFGGDRHQIQMGNCLFAGDAVIKSGIVPSFYAGGILSGMSIQFSESGGAYIDYDFLVEGKMFSGRLLSGSRSMITADAMALFAQAGNAIDLTSGSMIVNTPLSSLTKRIWGTSAGYAIAGDKRVSISYTAGFKPTATGASGDMSFGGYPYTWAPAPFNDDLTGVRVEEI